MTVDPRQAQTGGDLGRTLLSFHNARPAIFFVQIGPGSRLGSRTQLPLLSLPIGRRGSASRTRPLRRGAGFIANPAAAQEFDERIGLLDDKAQCSRQLRKRWPIDWPRDDELTPYELLQKLRAQEDRPPPVPTGELGRRGWASLLVRERSSSHPGDATLTGSTETCWNPAQRLHSGCAVWGDYVRAPGWIVPILIPTPRWGNLANGALSAPFSPMGALDSSLRPRSAPSRPRQRRSQRIAGNCASSFPRTPAIRRWSSVKPPSLGLHRMAHK